MEIFMTVLQIALAVTTMAMVLALATGAVILMWEEKERRRKNAESNRRVCKVSERTAVQDEMAENK
jgi:uncharacterized iron-regulated membrane protein